jgi:glycosyltransferase involved in cell wall biosynthesis
VRRRHVVISSFDSPGNPHYDGGGALVVERIARWLASDFDVTVLTAGHRSGTEMQNGVRYRHLPAAWAGPRAGQLLFHALLPFAAGLMPADVWIESFTPPFSTSFLPLFARGRVLGLALTLSGEAMWGRYRLPFFLVERLGLRFYRDVVVLNPADGESVRRYSPSAAVRVMPFCAELPQVDDETLGQGEHILFLGRIDIWQKGLDLLLAAYEQSGLTMPLIIAGNGTQGDERSLQAMLADASRDVRWVGRVDGQRKEDLLRCSSFMVMPSRHEGFGIAALEGMSHGKPVVHFDLPALRWMDGDIRVAPFDVGAMAAEMRDLAGSEEARRKLGSTALAAAQEFGPEQMAERYVALVHEMLGPPA